MSHFVILEKSAIVKGKGEKINFLKNKIFELPVILINPLVEISTKQIFENLDLILAKKKNLNTMKFYSKNFFNYLIEKKMIFKNQLRRFVLRLKKLTIF